jgi:hypothetical protein
VESCIPQKEGELSAAKVQQLFEEIDRLLKLAAELDVAGRSRMSKRELLRTIRRVR